MYLLHGKESKTIVHVEENEEFQLISGLAVAASYHNNPARGSKQHMFELFLNRATESIKITGNKAKNMRMLVIENDLPVKQRSE